MNSGVLGIAAACFLAGQAPPTTGEAAPESEATCVLERTEVEVKGGGKKAILRFHNVYAVHSSGETSDALRWIELPWRGSATRTKKARVEVRDRTGVRLERILPDFKVVPVWKYGTFVSDSKNIALYLPPLVPGDTLSVFCEFEHNPFIGVQPHVFGRLDMACEESDFKFKAPLDLDPRYRSWNGAGDPEVESSDDVVVWTWTLHSIGDYSREPFAPPPEDLFPGVSVSVNRIAWGPAGDWETIGASYLETISERLEKSEAVSPGFLTEDESVTGLTPAGQCLAFVQDELRYVNIVLGLGGWIPRTPDEIFRRKYGDCKDMSTLLLTLLNRMEVGASLALVRTRPPAGHRHDSLPTLAFFNHAVVITEDGSWLDATDPAGTEAIPREDIQGAPALVLSGPHSGFRRIPMTPPGRNAWNRTIRLEQQEDGAWRGSVDLELTGRWAHEVTYERIRDHGLDRFIQDLCAGLGVDEIADSAVYVHHGSRDSIVIRCSTPVPDPVRGDAFIAPFGTDLGAFDIFDPRRRETDVYWPGLFQRKDSVSVVTRWARTFEVADSTWSASVPGLQVVLTTGALPNGMTLSRSLRAVDPILPAKHWRDARRAVRKSLRWVTRSFAAARN